MIIGIKEEKENFVAGLYFYLVKESKATKAYIKNDISQKNVAFKQIK